MRPGQPLVKDIVDEIASLSYEGNIKAIATVLILENGDARTLSAYTEGQKFSMIAGVVFLQHGLLESQTPFNTSRQDG